MTNSPLLIAWVTLCMALGTNLTACSPSPVQDKPAQRTVKLSKAEMDALWAAEVEGAQKLGEIRRNFESAHPYKGVNTLAYVQQLKKEGFSCRLQPRERVKYSDGQAEKSFGFYTTLEPSISCEREPSQFDACKWFRVGLDIAADPPNPKLSYADLAKQLATAKITHAVFVCNIEPRAVEYLQFISEGIAKGTVVEIP